MIVDDLITTGGTVIDAINTVREFGGVVNELVVLLDREQGGPEAISAQGVTPHYLFKITDAFEWLHQEDLITNDEYQKLITYIESERPK